MAIKNPTSITYGSCTVGGTSSYQLHGPYVIDKSFERLQLVFDVVVTASSHSSLVSLCETLEADFRKRDQDLIIKIDTETTTYTEGTDILNVVAGITKSGDEQIDLGYSRGYTVTVEATLPADDDGGLASVEVLVDYEPSRQKIVTMRGRYTANGGVSAYSLYDSNFDAIAAGYLSFIDSGASFELVDETNTLDRHRSGTTPVPQSIEFMRQYVELLDNQVQASLNSTKIRDHRVSFTDLSQHPGDSRDELYRMRRVVGNYSCALDIDVTTDLASTYESDIRPHMKALFEQNYEPQAFALEEERVSFDRTGMRISVSFTFLYQIKDSSGIVEIVQSVAFRETRQLDTTPTHAKDELAAYVDPGWATVQRIWTRTVVAIGGETPKLRIAEKPIKAGVAGPFNDKVGGHAGPDATPQGSNVVRDGWNIVDNSSQVSPRWVGAPGEQIEMTVLTETVIEQFARTPPQYKGGNTTRSMIQRAPTQG